MNDDTQHDEFDEDFGSFENLDDEFDPEAEETALETSGDGHLIDDAEFEDISDDFDADVFDDDMDDGVAPKKVNWFNIGVAGVAVLIAGGLILSRLLSGGGDVSGVQQVRMDSEMPSGFASTDLTNVGTSSEASVQQAVQAAAQNDNNVMGGLLSDPDQFANLAQTSLSPQGITLPDVAPEIPADDPFAVLNTQSNVDNVPMPAPITTEIPMVAAQAMEPEVAPKIDMVVADTTNAVMPIASPFGDTATEPNVSALKGQVDGLETRLDGLNDKIEQAISRMGDAQNTNISPIDDDRLAKIEKVLDRLENRLDDLSTTQVVAAAPVKEKTVVKKAVSAPKKTQKSSKSKPKTQSANWDKAYSPSKTSSSGGWALKGAQPGQAIIGQSNGEIREIRVGDTVSGLGQITGIAPIQGRWVVQGTQGRLSQ